jgi:tRNA modification GTPase
MYRKSTIAAIATAPGRGGVGIVRVSGPQAKTIAEALVGFTPKIRYAHFTPFYGADGHVLDEGLCLYFAAPHSFTGEDVVEFQGHGGPVILDMVLERIVSLGAEMARPGEFSERAFLNDKIDLAQAEAVADLIAASSKQAAKQAMNSLQGVFSRAVNALVEDLIALRIYVEAAIDFPEEEVDFLGDGKIATALQGLSEQIRNLLEGATQGRLLQEGIKIVLAGRPNAGKSSLLNALVDREAAIVTPIAGTTRDLVNERFHLDGIPLHLVDTAGLRSSEDVVEQIGISRAWQEIHNADQILLLIDATDPHQWDLNQHWPEFFGDPQLAQKLILVLNKIDLVDPGSLCFGPHKPIYLSAKTGAGLEALKQQLKAQVGYQQLAEGGFSARRRHIEALERARHYLAQGDLQLQQGSGELVAEDLRLAQQHLGEITGTFTPDDLLGRIFSAFCIGK